MNAAIRLAAWHLHRYTGTGIVSLPAPIVGAILNRDTSKYHSLQMTASNASDEIGCGTAIVWRDGGRTVCEYVLAATSDHELDLLDYIDEQSWRNHVNRLAQRGCVPDYSHAPTSWRNGVRLTDMQRHKLLTEMEYTHGKLPEMMFETKGKW